MKQLLIETIPFNIANLVITENKISGNGRMRVRGKIQEAEVQNGNGRKYPMDILKREFDKYVEGPVKNRTALGELDHPDSSVINLNNVSHLITKVWWEGNSVMAELELLNTPSGRIAQEIASNNIPLGISTRGMGSVKQIDENTVEVQDDFDLLAADLVSTPSTPNAYLRPLSEGLNKNNNKYDKINSIITEIICNQTGVCALC
mgnify:FL=1